MTRFTSEVVPAVMKYQHESADISTFVKTDQRVRLYGNEFVDTEPGCEDGIQWMPSCTPWIFPTRIPTVSGSNPSNPGKPGETGFHRSAPESPV